MSIPITAATAADPAASHPRGEKVARNADIRRRVGDGESTATLAGEYVVTRQRVTQIARRGMEKRARPRGPAVLPAADAIPRATYRMRGRVAARAEDHGPRQFVVRAGAEGQADDPGRQGLKPGAAADLRGALLADGGLVPAGPGRIRLTRDVAFRNGSAAAMVLLGRQANGPTEWLPEGPAAPLVPLHPKHWSYRRRGVAKSLDALAATIGGQDPDSIGWARTLTDLAARIRAGEAPPR